MSAAIMGLLHSAMCKTVHTTVQSLVDHRFNCFGKIALFNLVIKPNLKSINYNTKSPIDMQINAKHKAGKILPYL